MAAAATNELNMTVNFCLPGTCRNCQLPRHLGSILLPRIHGSCKANVQKASFSATIGKMLAAVAQQGVQHVLALWS